MVQRKKIKFILAGSLILGPIAGCENLPGTSKQQGAVIGGAGGAAAGALVAGHNRLLGALIGGALGAGGGYLIGSQVHKTHPTAENQQAAVQASQQAQANPATPASVANSTTADLNNDGYVTMDEVVAMRQAGLSDDEQIRRLQATNQIFELTPQQEDYLRNNGVSQRVITAMVNMHPYPPGNVPPPPPTPGNEPISRPPA